MRRGDGLLHELLEVGHAWKWQRTQGICEETGGGRTDVVRSDRMHVIIF